MEDAFKALAKVVIVVIAVIAVLFLAPWLVLKGWDAARELWPTLPQATYWQMFWITFAIQTLVKIGPSTTKKS